METQPEPTQEAMAEALAALDRAQVDLFQARARLRALQAVTNPDLLARLHEAAQKSGGIRLDRKHLEQRRADLLLRLTS
jgi:hypothetical protein